MVAELAAWPSEGKGRCGARGSRRRGLVVECGAESGGSRLGVGLTVQKRGWGTRVMEMVMEVGVRRKREGEGDGVGVLCRM